MSVATPFSDVLQHQLQDGMKLRVYHVSTPATSCPPLYAAAPAHGDEPTTLESHFLAISQPRQQPTDPAEIVSDVIVLGIEVLIFASKDLTTLFVSKADSTGLLIKRSGTGPPKSLAQTVITTFLRFLLQSHSHNQARVVLSLFARSQNQYLFPGSIENATKNVLDDRQLIKWWCRVIDPLVRYTTGDTWNHAQAHLVVPGCDKGETRVFFPPSARADPQSDPVWKNAYPVNLLANDTTLPPRCLVPRFPDDPKARFLDDLDGQGVENGEWRNIRTLDQFWEMMAYRQECSAGRLVGFIWVVFPAAGRLTDSDVVASGITENSVMTKVTASPSPGQSDETSNESPSALSNVKSMVDNPNARSNNTVASGQARIRSEPQLRVPESEVDVRANNVSQTVLDQTTVIPMEIPGQNLARGEILLTPENYQSLMDTLLELDFAGEKSAVESTRSWRQKAVSLAESAFFGCDVRGKLEIKDDSTFSHTTSSTMVNIPTVRRKKREIDTADPAINHLNTQEASVNNLNASLIRKKPKR